MFLVDVNNHVITTAIDQVKTFRNSLKIQIMHELEQNYCDARIFFTNIYENFI